MTESILNVRTITDSKIVQIPLTPTITAEDVCITLCKQLGIGNVARHIFQLREYGKSIYLMPSHKFDIQTKNPTYELRVRFKVRNVYKLKKIDIKAYDYYFHQARNDVVDNKIPDLSFEKYRRELVGLGVTDMYRVMLEKDIPRENVESDYKKYIPKEVLKRHLFFVKKPIHDMLGKIKKLGHDAWYVKEQYLRQLEATVPDYPIEEYKALWDQGGSVFSIIVRVSTPNSPEPGIKYCIDNKRDKWNMICLVEELGFISIRQDSTVEISRKNGIPFYLKFNSLSMMYSFVSLLDGYYRLTAKWTFNICKDVLTPSLQRLYAMKCHGPVGGEFSYAKLEEKRANRAGCFILRESEAKYNIYFIDLCMKDGMKPKTFKLERLSTDEFIFNDDLTRYQNLTQLMAAYKNSQETIYLGECLPPSEYDQSPLLLCHPSSFSGDALIDGIEDFNLTPNPVCINTRDLQVYKGAWCYTTDKNVPRDACEVPDCELAESCTVFIKAKIPGHRREGSEGLTFVYRGMWRHIKGKKMEIAMKILKPEFKERHLKDLLELAGQWAFLQSSAIVRLFGVTLTSHLSMVMEYIKLGPLDEYLRSQRKEIKAVDLLEACSNLASALWHLAENRIVHGNIRCRKLLVSCHDDNAFTVKLADPGIHTSYTAKEVHWIPIECYANLNFARHSNAADVWAFATTLWEIFMFGEEIRHVENADLRAFYISGKRLYQPPTCPNEVYKLMLECWDADPHRRKLPQAVMRDINQMMYQVYNSRKRHAYATIKNMETRSLDSMVTETTTIPSQDELISAHEMVENDNLSVESSQWSMNSFGKDWISQDCVNDDYAFSCDFSNIFPNFNFPTTNSSIDSINSIQTIFELDNNWDIVFQGRIGQGFYGEVYKATLEHNSDKDAEPRLVAVKRLKPSAVGSCIQDFEREISIMKTLKHPNIVEILGVLQEPEVSLVMEFVSHGSLQSYLKINKDYLSVKQLLKYALDIAKGMDYLGKKNIVHRDLAARNILVVDENNVKISDFGLAQVVGTNNYYILKTVRELPIKWYAIECLRDGKFSSKSDVWSYGVTMCEVFALGEEPQLGIEKVEIPEQQCLLKALEEGIRFPCPPKCPQSVFVTIILPCWDANPHSRPLFAKLVTDIEELQTQY